MFVLAIKAQHVVFDAKVSVASVDVLAEAFGIDIFAK